MASRLPPSDPPGGPSAPGDGPESVPAPPTGSDRVDRGTTCVPEIRARRWRIRGTVKVLGIVEASAADVEGTLLVSGPVTLGSLTSRGLLDLKGALRVDGPLSADGSVRAAATIFARSAKARGTLRAQGEIVVDGAFEVRGTVEAPSVRAGIFDLRGNAVVPGSVRARNVVAELVGRSSIGSIEAEGVRLRATPPSPFARLFGRPSATEIGRIEASTVELERVDVEFVRAPEIRLGPAAHVTAVEGTIVTRHPTSRVGPESRSPPPPGLSR